MSCSATEQFHSASDAVAGSRGPGRIAWAPLLLSSLVLAALAPATSKAAGATAATDQKTVATLDKQYQKAVEQNDAATMARILSDDFVLVVGNGKVYTKSDLVQDAKSGQTHYAHQEDSDQTVRVWGDTAVVTAKLWAQGIEDGKAVDYKLWFSDTYVRTPKGWSYVFGMASLPLPGRAPQ